MKTTLLFLSFAASVSGALAQSQSFTTGNVQTSATTNERFIVRYLQDAAGNEQKVIYFLDTKTYVPCSNVHSARKRLRAGEELLDTECSCPSAVSGLIHPIMAGVGTNIENALLLFPNSGAVIQAAQLPQLDRIAQVLRDNPSLAILIEGHASADGSDAANLRLGEDRAVAVKTYLVKSGIAEARLTALSKGETQPIASNATEEGRVQNRRVEIKVIN